jgi:hypothetical protein
MDKKNIGGDVANPKNVPQDYINSKRETGVNMIGNPKVSVINKKIRQLLIMIRGLQKKNIMLWAAGAAVGVLVSWYPVVALVVFVIVLLLLGGAVVVNSYRSNQSSQLNTWELSLRNPDNDAAAAVSRSGEYYLVVAQAIEVIPHPQLNTRASIESLGWDPADVELVDQQSKFDISELAELAGGLKEFDPPDGRKFSLVETSYVTSDSPRLILATQRTSYFALRSVLPLVKADWLVRAKFGRLNPAQSRIPHSLCLHYVVRFASGDVLFMRRDKRSPYHGGLWSISGEEQVDKRDFLEPIPCLALFQRSFCEEVIALRDEIPLSERWKIAAGVIESMRLWSVFVEENIYNYSLLVSYHT